MIKIILADDHKIVRDGLVSLIEAEDDMEVAGEAKNGREALGLAKILRPDIVVMDINMPDMNGIEATRKIISEVPDVKVVAFSMHSDKRFVMEMLKAGASGYLLKDSAFEELVLAIKTVVSDKTFMSAKIADLHEPADIQAKNLKRDFDLLTSREREVLQLIAEGRPTKQIGTMLNISVKTVETHRRQIVEKLKTSSVAELTKHAIRHGITSLEP